MIEILWQYDPAAAHQEHTPTTADEARKLLMEGNRWFSELVSQLRQPRQRPHVVPLSAADLGLGDVPGGGLAQLPFAAVLSCADARVPTELVFGQAANDLFIVRVAGNVPGTTCIGSLDYAVDHLASVRLLAVLGHTGCGAVSAAVDAFLAPETYLGVAANLPLRAIVDSLLAPVRGATAALEHAHGAAAAAAPGYRAALIELSIILNAAVTAAVLRQTFQSKIDERLGVVFGVYNLQNRIIGLPDDGPSEDGWAPTLSAPPAAQADFVELARRMAKSRFIERCLRKAAHPMTTHTGASGADTR
jgi:carbonic anhydrase